MRETNADNTEQAELNRYRQAADVAYRYAKQKVEEKEKPGPDKVESAFGSDKKEEA